MASPGFSLQLSKLASATGTSPARMSLAIGSSTQGSFTNFEAASITSLTNSNSTPGYNQNFTLSLNFTGEGSKFSRVKTRAANFTFGAIGNTTVVADNGSSKQYQNTYNPGGTNCSTNTTIPLVAKFYDQGFNFNASGYNTNFSSSVTLYAPPKPTISVTGTTKPATCSNPAAPCPGATITVSINPGSYNGITGSTMSVYRNGALESTIASSATVSYTFGAGSSPTMYTGTSYTLYTTNNFGCTSDNAVGATTPTYP